MSNKKWGELEKSQWLAETSLEKNYKHDVLDRIFALPDSYRAEKYGQLSYDPQRYPLYALLSANWSAELPSALITAGVHGYETGGIYAALEFLETTAKDYAGKFNLVVVPCVSPWGYETNNRWNPYAVDPNRSFANEEAEESALLKQFVSTIAGKIAVHIDLHETTDRDKTVFRPALAARDGVECTNGDIPQGFYLVADEERPELDFQNAMNRSVEQVTPIAPLDEEGKILGEPAVSHGVILYPMQKLGLSGILTDAPYHSTTEIYPDGDWMTPESSIAGQIAAIRGGLDYVLDQKI
ncbi:M14 family metallocarboxypeptidase [Desulfovibrio sp. JC022]|uniref:M14 family metallopeptidase n=1 Tax=Desulfovibrio sp. JC022 TaxID=2593642 RepID=UPI0013D3106A|nr:M14 family metallocarboxypeptidase [Desulfovibrio sp. JC022]NDV23326.1 M14 family metallocarboxypeptidase [Desulfovibrio sp. JC022]